MARRRLVQITNRTTEPLDVMYDGAPDVIPPGYKKLEDGSIAGAGDNGEPLTFTCDYFAAEAYKRQHPRMGTQDPLSVDANDTEYLLGVEAWGDEVSHVEQTAADELIDRSLLPEQRQNATVVNLGREGKLRSARTKKQLKEKRKELSKQKARAQENRRSRFTDNALKAPTGMKANYD